MRCVHLVIVTLVTLLQADVIQSHFAPAAGTPERPAASVSWTADGKTHIAHFGRTTLPDGPAPGDHTIYEIGSITKTFTGTLLADMVLSREVTLDTTIGELLPEAATYPAEVRRITLGKIATHASGLPRLPTNLFATVKDLANPYSTYTSEHLDAFLRTFTPPADAKPEYSNLAFGVLGHVLARRAGKTYEQLIAERVLAPLGMRDTVIAFTDAHRARVAPGHAGAKVTANWDIPTFAGAGALRSTANDMAKYLKAVLDPPDTRVGRAIRLAREPRADFTSGARIGLGWLTRKTDDGRDLTWHNGGTGGYRSFIGVVPAAHAGLLLLTNSNVNPDPIAFKALTALAGATKGVSQDDAPQGATLRRDETYRVGMR